MTTNRRATAKIPAALSRGEEAFALAWRAIRGQLFEREHVFNPTRKWRFDFAWPAAKVAVEIDGGTWGNGRHSRGAGYAADCEKLNNAAMLGWCVIRLTPAMIEDKWIAAIKAVLEGRTGRL